MTFRPKVNDTILIENHNFTFNEHPSAKGMPYGQSGRKATVYQLESQGNKFALKVFAPVYREPRYSTTAPQLNGFSNMPGLQVCNRVVITPAIHVDLVANYPDLSYAVLMPWVVGETWQEIIVMGRSFTLEQSRGIARQFLEILTKMEHKGLAHCDLSGPNVIIDLQKMMVSLVDVEDIYGPGLSRPDKVSSGSAGYLHRMSLHGNWSVAADRFAGAVLIAEILGWSDERIRRLSYGEQYFDLGEIQQSSERYQMMLLVLRERWGDGIAAAFSRAWCSEQLDDCPSFKEWGELLDVRESPLLVNIPQSHGQDEIITAEEKLTQMSLDRAELLMTLDRVDEAVNDLAKAYTFNPGKVGITYARALMTLGSQQERGGDLTRALNSYKLAHTVVPNGGMKDELKLIVSELEQKATPEKGGDSLGACPECGGLIYPEQETCSACGYTFTGTGSQHSQKGSIHPAIPPSITSLEPQIHAPETSRLLPPTPPANPEALPKPKKKKKVVWMLLISLLVCLVAIFINNDIQNKAKWAALTQTQVWVETIDQQSTSDAIKKQLTQQAHDFQLGQTQEVIQKTVSASSTAASKTQISNTKLANANSTATVKRTQTQVSVQKTQVACEAMRVCEKMSVLGTNGWQNSNVTINKGDIVTIRWVSDNISNCAPYGCIYHDAVGDTQSGTLDSADNTLYGCLHGALIARIGNGQAICVGNSNSFTSSATGYLWMRTNDNVLTDNAGKYTVQIEVK